MLRGRPNIRREMRDHILEKLSTTTIPMTISMLTREAVVTFKRKISWNTVQKYLQELVESGRVQPIQLTHSKKENKSGLIVYTLKK